MRKLLVLWNSEPKMEPSIISSGDMSTIESWCAFVEGEGREGGREGRKGGRERGGGRREGREAGREGGKEEEGGGERKEERGEGKEGGSGRRCSRKVVGELLV